MICVRSSGELGLNGVDTSYQHGRPGSRPIAAIAAALLMMALLLPASAWAEGTERAASPAPAEVTDPIEDADVDPPSERALPNYDGRSEPPLTAIEVMAWVPRVVFFPVFVVTEYVIRAPLGFIVTSAEEGDWPTLLVDFFTFNDAKIGIVPTAFFEFDFLPSVGLYFFWDGFIHDDNDFRLHAATWGPDWIRVTVRDRMHLDRESGTSLSLRFVFERRRDHLFYGLGPRSRQGDIARYSADTLEPGIELETDLGDYLGLRVGTEYKISDFEDGGCCDEPSLGDRVLQQRYLEPPGFEEGFSVLRGYLDLAFDTRGGGDPNTGARPESETGVRLFAHADYAVDPQQPDKDQWIRYGGAAGFFWNTGGYRTLGLKFQTAFADAIGDNPVPFTQQAVVGGSRVTSNVREARLIGESTLFGTLEYRWPIWSFLDGHIEYAMGNVFGRHLEDFAFDLLRWSVGFGFSTVGQPDHTFEINFGFMGEPIDEGAELDTFRFFVGAKSAF